MGPLTGIIPGKRVSPTPDGGMFVHDENQEWEQDRRFPERPALAPPVLPHEPGMNRAQRRAAKKARK